LTSAADDRSSARATSRKLGHKRTNSCAKDFIGMPYCGQIKDQRYARSFLEPVVFRE
jgi:hypothetical protein